MRGFAAVALDNPKSPVNIGGALRAAYNYNAAFLVASGNRYHQVATDTEKAYRHLPLFHRVEDVMAYVPFDCMPVAVDLVEGAEPLTTFQHPERAFYVFGAEDGTLGARILTRCARAVYVPMKSCMNLAATVNVVLYDRLCKQQQGHGNYNRE